MANLASASFISLVLVFLLLAPSKARPGIMKTNDLVGDICLQAKNSSFCYDALKSPAIIDAEALAMYTLNMAESGASTILNILPYLIKTTPDPTLRNRYKLCNTSLSEAVPEIETAKKDLSSKNYKNLKKDITSVKDDVCVDAFVKPPVDPSALPINLKVFENICDVAFAIASYLLGLH